RGDGPWMQGRIRSREANSRARIRERRRDRRPSRLRRKACPSLERHMTYGAESLIRTERHGSTVVLWLDRPAQLNRLSTESQFLELAAKIREADADPDARALIITGSGPAF